MLSPRLVNDLSAAKCPACIANAQVGKHRFAGNSRLSHRDQWRYPLGQINVKPRTEAEHAEALTGIDRVAAANEADNSPGDKTGNLHNGNTRAGRRDND